MTKQRKATAAYVLRVLAEGRDTREYAEQARAEWRALAAELDAEAKAVA